MPEPRKIKLLWSHRRFGFGGTETFALNILPLLAQNLDITVMLTSGIGSLVPRLKHLGLPVIKADMKGKLNRNRIAHGARLLANLAPDIVHTHSFDNHFMVRSAAILARTPLILTHHHTLPGVRYTPRLLNAEARLLPATDRSLFVCATAHDQFWQLMKDRVGFREQERLMVIHDAFDVEAIDAAATEDQLELVRRSYALTPDTRIIGTVARIHPVKNLELLLHTVALLRSHYPTLKCFIVGDGDEAYLAKIHTLADQLALHHNLVFTGFQHQVAPFLRLFEVTALTSHVEGLPRCVVESYAVGTPVVASDIPSIREIVEHEKEGFLAHADSPEEFARYIALLLSNRELRHTCGQRARQRSQSFALKPYAEKLCSLYDTLLSSPPLSARTAKRKFRLRYFFTRNL